MPYKTYKVEGSVKNYFGNQMDYLDKKTDLKKSHKILAVEGIFLMKEAIRSKLNY